MTHLSLFSGIGGIDLAAHWAGFRTVQFVEKDPFCQKVLAKNFPGVPIHDDVKTFKATDLRGVDLLSGGIPCQGFSSAGKRGGMADERSALASHFIRVAGECRPAYAVIENSPNIIRDAGRWLTDALDGIGYGIVGAFVYPACLFGAWFKGERAFIVSTPYDRSPIVWRLRQLQEDDAAKGARDYHGGGAQESGCWQRWPLESRPYGVADGIPDRVDRITALGNAVRPQQIYPVLKAIADFELEATENEREDTC